MAAWFRPRRYGIGATPVSWQGWVLVGAYVALVLGTMWLILPHQGGMPLDRLAIWAAVMIVASAVIIWIAHRNTEGGWHWRWGDRRR